MSAHIDDMLADYLAGALDEDQRAAFDTHVSECGRCRREVQRAEEQLGELLGALEPVAPPPALAQRIMADLEPSARLTQFRQQVAQLIDRSIEHAETLLRGIDEPANWKQGPGPGIRLFHIDGGPATEGAIVGFIRLAPDALFPKHKHLGEEKVFVLQGSFEDAVSGRTYRPGDLVVETEDSEHYFTACAGPELIYLVVADGGIEMFGVEIGPDHPAL